MGVSSDLTDLHRATHFDNLDSEGLDEIYKERLARKRGGSSVSHASQTSASRSPSPYKRGRTD